MAQPGPNPQTNLIISIVAPVVALITVAVLYFTKPAPVAPPPPAPVNVAPAKLPDPGLQPANALPNSGSSVGGSTGGAGGGMAGGPMAGMGRGQGRKSGGPMGAS